MLNEIEKFIIKFSLYGKQVKLCFTERNCYWFAYILHARFPNSKIMLNTLESHFACNINGELYDITGKCTDKYAGEWVDWDEYQMTDSVHSARLLETCINNGR